MNEFEVKAKSMRREELEGVKMFKSIVYGDPSYLEEFTGKKLQELTYIRNFKGKNDWIMKAFIDTTEFEIEGEEYEDIALRLFCAKDEKVYNSIIKSKLSTGHISYPKGTTLKVIDIGLDTAKFELSIDDRYTEVDTMADGQTGTVIEVFEGKKLVGIMLDIGFGEYSYDKIVQTCQYLLNIKRNDNLTIASYHTL